jgi:ribosomal protein S18 acetylase RimI-like enzyme
MTIQLRNNKSVLIRHLEQTDAENLYHYLDKLSAESRSRFGPHPFDWNTIKDICDHLPGDTRRYIAVDASTKAIVAYMLVKNGMIEWDAQRYSRRGQSFDENCSVTFAPSVADAWQSSGLGWSMNEYIEKELRESGKKTIILWGGVQASNLKAVNFYRKLGYKYIASFWHDGKDNYDMVKELG